MSHRVDVTRMTRTALQPEGSHLFANRREAMANEGATPKRTSGDDVPARAIHVGERFLDKLGMTVGDSSLGGDVGVKIPGYSLE